MNDTGDLVYPLLCLMVNVRAEDGNRYGLAQIGALVLHSLSVDREFAIALCHQPFGNLKLPPGIPYFRDGTHADFVFLCIYHMITTGDAVIMLTFPQLFKIITNMSPYVTGMTSSTAAALMSLLRRVTSRRFLEGGYFNYQYADFVLLIFVNCVQYQYAGTVPLTHQIMINPSVFFDLAKYLEYGTSG